jgi:hypothetical protein
MAPTPEKRRRQRRPLSPQELAICHFWEVRYVAAYCGVRRDTIIRTVTYLIERDKRAPGMFVHGVDYLAVVNHAWKPTGRRDGPNVSYRISRDSGLQKVMKALSYF